MSTGLSFAPGLHGPQMGDETIGEIFTRAVRTYGHNEALVDAATERSWTYAELGAEVDALAKGILARGISKGDRIGICAPNCPEWTIVQLAAAKVGAVVVAMDHSTARFQLADVVRRSDVRMLICKPKVGRVDYCSLVEDIAPACPSIEWSVFIGSLGWDALISGGAVVADEDLAAVGLGIAGDDPGCVQFASDNTGTALSHDQVLGNAYMLTERLDYGPGSRVCVPVPFSHAYGMAMGVVGVLMSGACIVISGPSDEPRDTLRAIQGQRATSLLGLQRQVAALAAAPGRRSYDVDSLITAVVVGATDVIEVVDQAGELFPQVLVVP